MEKPLLSIGMIFRNEIRCLERCLKSLQPLRDAIPCELVMADTGAEDGSRAVADKYADILIDFPWVNDFAAARNAVMDRCSGEWYMSIDSDEWVDENIDGFVAFLTGEYDFDFASVIIRNYDTLALDKGGSYSDFLGTRLLRMSTGLRYEGAIHEHWRYSGTLRTMRIRGAVFHHDGYVYQDKARMKKKMKRNMDLLRKQLDATPNDLIILSQCIDSSDNTLEQEGYIRRALVGVAEKWSQWELFGGPIYRQAVRMALRDDLPELEQWISEAESQFPNSVFLRVEIAYFAFGHYWTVDNYPEALRWGEIYLQGVEDYRAGHFNQADLLASALDKVDTHSYLSVAAILTEGYLHEKQPGNCVRHLDQLDPAELDNNEMKICVQSIYRLHSEFGWDTRERICRFWDRLSESVPDKKSAKERQAAFIQTGTAVFSEEYREREAAGAPFYYAAYTAFLPLAGRCVLGTAAAILEADSPEKMEELLAAVEDWTRFPIHALRHMIEKGARFPLAERPLNLEVMDALASRLAADWKRFLPLVQAKAQICGGEDGQQLLWKRGLLLAALRSFRWTGPEESETSEEDAAAERQRLKDGQELARMFAAMEKAFLPRCYAKEALCTENLYILPMMHRFGWYCVQAFDRLDADDTAGYVRLLRKGLASCPEMTPMVEFLLDRLEERRQSQTAPELLELAQQVRTVLAQYPADDPAVAALKQSAAYRQVRHLIEGPELNMFGGLSQ